MHTLMQPVTTADFHSGHSLELIAGCIACDPDSGDLVSVDIIDGCAVVDLVDIQSASRYTDGPIFPTDGGDWTELHGSLRAIIAIHVLRIGYSRFVYGRYEVILVPTY